ncbi:MAG: hypothetical protein L0956_04420 [Candidatus Mariimomonas ferrooxydans]
MTEIIKDFDKLIPDKRIAILSDRKFDVSLISTRMALKQVAFRDNVLKMNGEAAFRKAVEIVAEICGKPKSSKDSFWDKFTGLFKGRITAKWLVENTNYEQLVQFIDFVLEPLTDKAEVKAEDKAEKKK